MLHTTIETAFDNGEVVIVPHGDLKATPTEWKMVVLRPDLMDVQVYQDPITDEVTTWKVSP